MELPAYFLKNIFIFWRMSESTKLDEETIFSIFQTFPKALTRLHHNELNKCVHMHERTRGQTFLTEKYWASIEY